MKILKKLGLYNIPAVVKMFFKSEVTNADVGKEKTEIRFLQTYSLLGKIVFTPFTFLIYLVKYGICGLREFDANYYYSFRLVVNNNQFTEKELSWLDKEVRSNYANPDLSKAFPLEKK